MNKIDFQTKKIDFYIKRISIFIFCSILFLTIAYADSSITGKIEGIMASVRPTSDARITGIRLDSATNNGISNSEDYNVESVYGTVDLGNSDSTVTYKISVTVFLASEMKISAITGMNPELEYVLSDYQIGDTLCNSHDECNYGATAEFDLTIRYKAGEYDGINTTFPFHLDFTFEEVDYVAKIGNHHYESLQAAIDDAPANNTETTTTLIKNTSEVITVPINKNIRFNLQNNVLSNDGTNPVISNYGTVKITNGIITSNTSQGAINNEAGGNMTISGGKVIATGSRQAVYNKGGTIEITGNAYLSAITNQRGTVQNLDSGIMLITGGTIISTGSSAVANTANLTIGTKDGTIGQYPNIQGNTYGINSTTSYGFYDGIISGKTAAVNDETLINDRETGMDILHETNAINNVNYKSIRLANVVIVTFNANGGTVDELTRELAKDSQIGTLPSPTLTGYEFQGWYTELTDGRKISPTEVITSNQEFFAHWLDITQIITAEIGGNSYNTLQKAIDAVPRNNTQTTIKLVRDTSETLSIKSQQNIVFNLQNYTISNNGVNPVISNRGTLTISNGTITSNTTQGAINNESGGKLTISGGQIIATGTRQAIYNNGGTLFITGTAYLTSTTNERATVQNLNNGNITVTGGTIISTGLNGIENTATLTIGTKDGNILTNTPIIQGVQYGINNTSVLNYYDGVIKGKDDTINGIIDDQEVNSTRVDGTEVISGETYHTVHLES